MNKKLNQNYINHLQMMFPKNILSISQLKIPQLGNYNSHCQITTADPKKLAAILFLYHNTYIKSLIDLFGIDYMNKSFRFQVVYQFISLLYHNRVFIKTWARSNSVIQSITSIFPSANWYERECWDLYGIVFQNHPDLRRILTDYGFQGHPFRKDFPLSGFVELRYDERYQRISYEPIKSVQEYRVFDTLTPWTFHHNKHFSAK